MTQIYICDDEPVWVEQMEQAVLDFMVDSDWALTVAYQSTQPHGLLACLAQNRTLGGIYFLDIDLKSDINGIGLGAKIRDLDPEAVLIFVTTHDELVMETFRLKLQATDYILKDGGNLRSQITETLRTVEARYGRSSQRVSAPRIRLSNGNSFHYVIKDDIYFVETQKNRHRLYVHMRSKIFIVSTPLKDIASQLGDGFLLCRRGCLINPLHVAELNRDTKEIIFDNQERCSCSYREWQLVLKRIPG